MLNHSQGDKHLEVIISGAGITGIAAALHCHKRGIRCEIRESGPAAGGILQDWQVDDDWYFRNCQYLTPGTDWFQLLPKSHLMTFPHTYGSFTDLWGEACSFRGFAGPVYSLKALPGELRKASALSLSDRLNIYPQPISEPLIEWVKRFGICPEKVHWSGATGFKISRIFPLHLSNYIQSMKKVDSITDELYGLPREMLNLPTALAALPREGFTQYFKHIEKHLLEKKIKLLFRSTTKPTFLLQPPENEDSKYSGPTVIWTGNPTSIIKKAEGYALEAPYFQMRNIVAKWKNHRFSYPFYIQVFSRHHSVTRIYVYLNKATIECFHDEKKSPDIVSSALEILLPFLGKIETPEEIHEFSEKRHFLCSLRDYAVLESFSDINAKCSLIPSPWHIYGRDAKIHRVLGLIDKFFSVSQKGGKA